MTTPIYGMTIDVNRCVGCQTCTIACKHANDTSPDVQWRKVLDVERGNFPDVSRFFLVTGCQHCAEPPCVPVCPTGATFQREDGLVVMDYDQCIGCAYCAVACPYEARTIVHEDAGYFGGPTAQEAATAHPERIGVAQKCTFCIERIDEAHAEGLTPGKDWDVTPACAASCIAKAITFGDFNDPRSEVSQQVESRKSLQINDFLGTNPQIRYLYEVPDAIPAPTLQSAETSAEDPLAGSLQSFWDWRAAMNFVLGGMGSGLLAVAALLALTGGIAPEAISVLLVMGGVFISSGLAFVFWKIGRPSRALKSLNRPGTSWMTREIYSVVVLFALMALVFFGASWLTLAVGIAAVAFLFCQAQILRAAKGIPVWRHPAITMLIVATGIAEGTGGALILSSAYGHQDPLLLQTLALVASIGTVSAFTALIREPERHHLPKSVQEGLNDAAKLYLPGCLLAVIVTTLLPLVGGLMLIAAGAAMKLWLITRASFFQGLSLQTTPGRGSGDRAAPPRLTGFTRSRGMG